MDYQSQSAAWIFGGEDVAFRGDGYGTLDKNGQGWYHFVNGTSNYPRRSHAITISEMKNTLFEEIRFLQSQMWYASQLPRETPITC